MKNTVTNGIEKRVVSGKPRSCKIIGGKVSEVYDSFDKRYIPLNEFLKLYNEKGERLGVVKESSVSQLKLVSEEDVKVDIDKDIGTGEDIDPYSWYLKKIYRK